MNDLISRETLIKRCMNGIDNEFIPIVQDAPAVPTIPIPEGATNGDMIKALFPNVKIKGKNNCYETYFGIGTALQFFNKKWWNAPYKRGETE